MNADEYVKLYKKEYKGSQEERDDIIVQMYAQQPYKNFEMEAKDFEQ